AVARAVEAGLGAAGTIVAMNNRVSQSVHHLHVHVVPRDFKGGPRGFFWPRTKFASPEEARDYAGRVAGAPDAGCVAGVVLRTAGVAAIVTVPALVLWQVMRGRRDLGTSPAERATFETLHTASLAGPPLRAGLTADGAERASRHLRRLLGSPALAITDGERLLVYDGEGAGRARPRRLGGRRYSGAQHRLRPARLPGPAGRGGAADDRRPGGRHARRLRPARLSRAGPGRPGGGGLGGLPAGAGRARPVPHAADGGGGAGAARADLPALHLQLAHHDRLVRPHRPGAGQGAAAGVRRLHPLLLPAARRVHHARRGAALHRPLPDPGARPLRRPASGDAPHRAGGAAGRGAVPVPAAAGRERGP